jgi:hypothetical protein
MHVTGADFDLSSNSAVARLAQRALLSEAAERAVRYLDELDERTVAPSPQALGRLGELGGPMPDRPSSPEAVLALLDDGRAHLPAGGALR